MKICLIGQNLTNLILASVFEEKKLNVDIYLNKKFQKIKTHRTIALSRENFDYLKFLTKSSKNGGLQPGTRVTEFFQNLYFLR